MPSLPITLPAGMVLIYGENTTSFTGVVPGNTNIRFGTIYQIWEGGQTFIYGGDQVMYDITKVDVRLAANSTDPFQYIMMPAKLTTKEEPLP